MAAARDDLHIREAQQWLEDFASEVRGEVPYRLHQGHGGLGYAPPFTDDFNKFIGTIKCARVNCWCKRSDNDPDGSGVYFDGDGNKPEANQKTKANRAFRKLRKASPIEFDVCYLAVMHGLSLAQIVDRLNARAARNNIDEQYGLDEVAILALCGIDKLMRWY